MKLAISLLFVVVSSGCTRIALNMIERNQALRMLPHFANCPDGDPIRLLIERRCPGGVCGYSCLPHRWELTGADEP